jgi:hypothetical protein
MRAKSTEEKGVFSGYLDLFTFSGLSRHFCSIADNRYQEFRPEPEHPKELPLSIAIDTSPILANLGHASRTNFVCDFVCIFAPKLVYFGRFWILGFRCLDDV